MLDDIRDNSFVDPLSDGFMLDGTLTWPISESAIDEADIEDKVNFWKSFSCLHLRWHEEVAEHTYLISNLLWQLIGLLLPVMPVIGNAQ